MDVVADESIDFQIVVALRAAGHYVFAVAEACPGIADDEVLALASDRRSLLITQDKDFGELVFRLGQASSGVLLLRLSGVAADEKAELAVDVLRDHGTELVAAFSVLDKLNLRIRPHGA